MLLIAAKIGAVAVAAYALLTFRRRTRLVPAHARVKRAPTRKSKPVRK